MQLPGGVLPEATRALDGTLRELTGVRALRAERLLRDHRATLERDPRGDLVVRAEVIAIDLADAALANAIEARFTVLRAREFAELGIKITVLATPEGWSAARGLKRLRKLDPEGTTTTTTSTSTSGGRRGFFRGRARQRRLAQAVLVIAWGSSMVESKPRTPRCEIM